MSNTFLPNKKVCNYNYPIKLINNNNSICNQLDSTLVLNETYILYPNLIPSNYTILNKDLINQYISIKNNNLLNTTCKFNNENNSILKKVNKNNFDTLDDATKYCVLLKDNCVGMFSNHNNTDWTLISNLNLNNNNYNLIKDNNANTYIKNNLNLNTENLENTPISSTPSSTFSSTPISSALIPSDHVTYYWTTYNMIKISLSIIVSANILFFIFDRKN